MKTLILLRHAKSDWPEDMPDFDRPLMEKGTRQAQAAAEFISETYPELEHIISSPAQRTKETVFPVALKMNKEVKYDERLYNASEKRFYEVASELSDEISCVMLVSHNNGISNFANSLSEEIIHFSTAGIAAYALNISSWQEITEQSGKLISYDEPDDFMKD